MSNVSQNTAQALKGGKAELKGLRVDENFETGIGVGAVAGSGIEAIHNTGVVKQTVLTLDAREVTITDALAYASSKLFDFPEGRISILGAIGTLQFAITSDPATTINASAALDWSLGSAPASATALASTMVDLIPKVDAPLADEQDELNAATSGVLAAGATFDGTATPLDAYLNLALPTGTEIDADGTLEVTGTITITWVNLGDK